MTVNAQYLNGIKVGYLIKLKDFLGHSLRKDSELLLHRFTAYPIVSPNPLSSSAGLKKIRENKTCCDRHTKYHEDKGDNHLCFKQ